MSNRQPLRPPAGRYDSPRTGRGRGLWRRRLSEPGWVLLPLRLFLGVTFVVASLQKLANPAFFDPSNPTSVAAQMRAVQHTSPIGGLVGLSLHAPTAVGLLIAVAELAVGVGVLAGLWTRLAAAGGMLLALSFFLTISWTTTPYYYGADIVFLFAFTPLLLAGSGGVLSLGAWAARQARRESGIPDGVDPATLTAAQRELLARRTVLRSGGAAAGLAVLGLVAGGLTAAVGRLTGSSSPRQASGPAPAPSPTTSPGGQQPTPGSGTHGRPIVKAADLPVGQARRFVDDQGEPAYVVHESSSTFKGFSAICTHAGCTVSYDSGSREFVCPCHGGVYDARTGAVVAGPPPAPLPPRPVTVSNGEVYLRS